MASLILFSMARQVSAGSFSPIISPVSPTPNKIFPPSDYSGVWEPLNPICRATKSEWRSHAESMVTFQWESVIAGFSFQSISTAESPFGWLPTADSRLWISDAVALFYRNRWLCHHGIIICLTLKKSSSIITLSVIQRPHTAPIYIPLDLAKYSVPDFVSS